MYAIITENDISQWNDEPGKKYHFPNRYKKYLQPGTEVIFYKGTLQDKRFLKNRRSKLPHYFAYGVIGKIEKDPESTKNDLYAFFSEYKLFYDIVLAKENGTFIERIPESRKTNYWRDGVRPIEADIFFSILKKANFNKDEEEHFTLEPEFYEEGTKILTYTTRFERDPHLREKVIKEKGVTCVCCGFNFEKFYGEIGKGFIHIHHIEQLSSHKGTTVKNSVEDLVPVCPNCHMMIHRNKDKPLAIETVRELIRSQQNKPL